MKRVLACMLAAAAFWCACSDDTVAGGGSERPNAPAFSADVEVRSAAVDFSDISGIMYVITVDTAGFNWAVAETAYVDTGGTVSLKELDPGYYTLVLENGGLLGFSGYFYHDTLTVIDSIVMDVPRSMQGAIFESTGPAADNVILGLVGTPYFDTVSVTDNGIFLFPAVPSGDFKMEISALSLRVNDGADSIATSVIDSFALNPGMVNVDNSYITVPGITFAGTSFTASYAALPEYDVAPVDTVTAGTGSVEVVNSAYRIEVTVK